jgi:hypothetical protein
MKRLILVGTVGLCLNLSTLAQDIQPYGYYIDALRFSQTNLGGSTRIQSLGGSQISLGGDLSLALSNPAGLGFYNRSEFSLTPVLNFKNSESNYLGNTTSDSKTPFNFNQIGIAFKLKAKEESAYKGGAFAITLSRINDFNNNYTLEGINEETSIIDSFLEQADGATTDQFSGNDVLSLSYDNYLIGPESILNPPGPDDVYFTDVNGIPLQTERIKNEGAQYQWSFSYGGNVNDLVYFGLGLGIVDLDYRSERTYSESFVVDPLFETELQEVLEISGTGVNGTVGFILKPTPYINIGASFIAPTYYGLDDTYTADMYSDWNNFLYEDAIDGDTLLNFVSSQTDILISDYNLTTPWRLNGGVAFFIGKVGFITADVEYIDYSTAKLNSNLFSMQGDNQAIKQMASSVVNIKTGAEFRINVLRLRAGYANYATAQGALDPLEGNGNVFTGGLGVRLSKYYFDLGVVHNRLSQSYAPYIVQNGTTPIADISSNNTKIMLTLGFKF